MRRWNGWRDATTEVRLEGEGRAFPGARLDQCALRPGATGVLCRQFDSDRHMHPGKLVTP